MIDESNGVGEGGVLTRSSVQSEYTHSEIVHNSNSIHVHIFNEFKQI